MKETESTILRRIQVSASQLGARLFRNNVGLGWVGQAIRPISTRTIVVAPSDIVIRNARPLHAGLCEGSSDLVGWVPLTITPDMVGKTVAVFAALEVKTPDGRVTEEQQRFIAAVAGAGGVASLVRSVDDATKVIRGS